MAILVHGIDLVEISRIAGMLDEHGETFVRRCFTEAEQRYCEDGGARRPERYAARFAAKEAVLKALGTGWADGISWCDVQVLREPSGKPRVSLAGRCAAIASGLGITDWEISLSHTDTHAAASVIGSG